MTKHSKLFTSILIIFVVVTCMLTLSACSLADDIEIIDFDDGRVSSDGADNSNGTDSNNSQTTPPASTPESGTTAGDYDIDYDYSTTAPESNLADLIEDELLPATVIVKTDKGQGSGVFVGNDAEKNVSYIMTCCHVIEGASSIKAIFNDETEINCTLLGGDDHLDVAVLKVTGISYPTVKLRDTTTNPIRMGEDAIAIGNPLGYGLSASKGIVSATARELNMNGTVMTLLQIDTAINSGNSGGPLFDAAGNLIGIVNAKMTGESSSGADIDGMGYAIPIDIASEISKNIVQTSGNSAYNGLGYEPGKIKLGISTLTISLEDITNSYGKYGYQVATISEYGSVVRSGIGTSYLDKNDILVAPKLNNGATTNFNDENALFNIVSNLKIGDVITFTALRPSYSWGGTSYAQYTFNVTAHQYVYGFKG